jgi:hypothetical protein
MAMLSVKRLMLATAVFAAAPFLTAYSPASQTISLQAHVPVLCRVEFQGGTLSATDGPVRLGQSDEFCNVARGYRLYALATGPVDGASLTVNGTAYPLSAGDEFVLVNSSYPDKTSRDIIYDAGSSAGGGSLSLRIQAK